MNRHNTRQSGSGQSGGDVALVRRLLREARPYTGFLVVFFVVSLLAAPVALLTPVPLKIAVDSGLGATPLPDVLARWLPSGLTGGPGGILLFSALLVVLVMILRQAQWVTSALLRTVLSERMLLDFRAKLFRHVQRLSFSFHDRKGSADSTYRIQWDAMSLQNVTIDGVIPFIASILTLVAMVAVTFSLNWQLGLVAVAVAPVLVGTTQYFRPRLRRRAKEQKELESAAFSVIPETIGALRVVKAFGQEDREQGRFVDESRATLRAKIRYTVTECGMGVLVGLTTAVGTAAVLYVGARQVVEGRLTLGELLMALGYVAQLYGPLKGIGRKVAAMQVHLASAERAFALLDEPMDVPDSPHGRRLDRARGEVSFNQVSFAYEEGHEIFSDVSLQVPAGTRVGIAGQTGAGKTTFVSLLMRFYDVTRGKILLDGVDLRDYRLADLRRQFSIVLQDPVLFSTTIAENIAYGRADASEEDITAAARAANAHDFIQALPDGYGTLVGERGMRLSGGERQRISLARAFLTDAPILVMDEPTSSVDTRTEAAILEAIDRLMKRRTTFMIAHRLSTLENCDLHLQLEDGRLTARRADPPGAVAAART